MDDRIDFDVAAGLQAEHGAAVVEQVELDVAAAADQLFLALGLGPGLAHPAADDGRIDVEEGLAHVAGEGEVARRSRRCVVVVEDAADAARLVPVRQEEVLVAPGLVLGVPAPGRARRRRPSGGVEGERRGRPGCAASSSTGVRSPPPPNQLLVVAMKRVFMCTAGTRGLRDGRSG